MSAALLLPRQPPRRSNARASTWWGRSWVRAVEEAVYGEEDLKRGRALARAGRVGQLSVDDGSVVAAVEDDRGMFTVTAGVPLLEEIDALVEVVAAESGRIAALLAGDLPYSLVEHAEEAGVELLPYGGEFTTGCTCEHWIDPCPHAVAVLSQLAWFIDGDPLLLLHLRGLSREQLLARLHARAEEPPAAEDPDLEVALDAAARAARLLELLEAGRPVDHLF